MNRTCKTCGTELVQIKHESKARFMGKKYCSAKCARVDLKKQKRGWWSSEFEHKFSMEVNTYE